MKDNKFLSTLQKIYVVILGLIFTAVLLSGSTFYCYIDPTLSLFKKKQENQTSNIPQNVDLIENGIHVSTGLIAKGDFLLVVQNCTSCHSSKMIIQNRATKEGWRSMIKWMQQTQNLWDLGTNEEKIITYLATNYPPQKRGRRAVLTNIEWYELD